METAALIAARELSPLILSLRERTEGGRNVAEPILDRLREGRLCRVATAKTLAGLELPVEEALDVYATLAYADASVAWIAWNNALPSFFGRFFLVRSGLLLDEVVVVLNHGLLAGIDQRLLCLRQVRECD